MGRTPAGVSIAITRDPGLVRTVRLVAAAVARRAGQDEDVVEEIRLAVGEACALFVGPAGPDGPTPLPRQHEPADESATVTVTLDIGDRLRVEVAGTTEPEVVTAYPGSAVDPWALLSGLGDEISVVHEGSSTAVSMSWPLG